MVTPSHHMWPRVGLGGCWVPKLTPALAPGYQGGELAPLHHGGQPGGGQPGGGHGGPGGPQSSHGDGTQLDPFQIMAPLRWPNVGCAPVGASRTMLFIAYLLTAIAVWHRRVLLLLRR